VWTHQTATQNGGTLIRPFSVLEQGNCRHQTSLPMPPHAALDETISCMILLHWRRFMKNDVIHKTGSTYHIALLSEEDFGRVVFEVCEWTDRQTDRQTDMQTR